MTPKTSVNYLISHIPHTRRMRDAASACACRPPGTLLQAHVNNNNNAQTTQSQTIKDTGSAFVHLTELV